MRSLVLLLLVAGLLLTGCEPHDPAIPLRENGEVIATGAGPTPDLWPDLTEQAKYLPIITATSTVTPTMTPAATVTPSH